MNDDIVAVSVCRRLERLAALSMIDVGRIGEEESGRAGAAAGGADCGAGKQGRNWKAEAETDSGAIGDGRVAGGGVAE